MAAEIDYEGIVSTWLRLIPATPGVRLIQLWSGEAKYAETDAGPDAARNLSEIATNAVNAAGKGLAFSLRALDKAGEYVCSYPLRIPFADGEVGQSNASRMVGAQAAIITELLSQNRALNKLLVDSMGPILTGSAAAITAMSNRATSELVRADSASEIARQAMDVADAAVKQAQEAAASQGSRPALERLVIQYVCKELGVDVAGLGPVVAGLIAETRAPTAGGLPAGAAPTAGAPNGAG
jgi:hypothetical protein